LGKSMARGGGKGGSAAKRGKRGNKPVETKVASPGPGGWKGVGSKKGTTGIWPGRGRNS